MKKVTKKQKVILTLGFVLIIIFGLRPALERIEMLRNDHIAMSEYVEVYIQATKDIEISKNINIEMLSTYDEYRPQEINFKKDTIHIAGLKQDNLSCVSWEWSDCLPKDSYRLLNTDSDKGLIKDAFSKNKESRYSSLEFKDYNQDGVDDVYINLKCHRICDPGEGEGHLYSIYSVNNNHLLWGFSRNMIFEGNKIPNIQFFYKNNTELPIIVIFTPSPPLLGKNNYEFFKYSDVDGYLLKQKPLKADWENYWKNISTFELLTRVFGLWGTLLLIFILLILLTLFFVIILTLIIKFSILQITSKIKLKH